MRFFIKRKTTTTKNKNASSTIYVIGNHFRMVTILLRRVRELFCSQIIVVYFAPNKHLDQPGHRQSMVSFRCPRAESKDPQPNRCPQEESFQCTNIHNAFYVRTVSLMISSLYGSSHPLHPRYLLMVFFSSCDQGRRVKGMDETRHDKTCFQSY